MKKILLITTGGTIACIKTASGLIPHATPLELLKEVEVHGISHITGGGFYENIPRSIPEGLGAKIDKSKVRILPIFDLIQKVGGISERDMFNTYNMGVGMSIVVAAEDTDKALEILKANGEDAYVIGSVIESDEGVIIE